MDSNPLTSRYASRELSSLFAPLRKYETWRRLWIALAKAQKKLGVPITDAQIGQLEKHSSSIDFTAAEKWEKITHHDVMAHIKAYGEQCPEAKGIIHLGCTSCFVTDNGDLLQMKEGLKWLESKLHHLLTLIEKRAYETRGIPCLSYTHFQPAQPTTVGKRICLWLQDLLFDYQELRRAIRELHFLGAKGATGTQASYLELFDGDEKKVEELDQMLAKEFGFTHLFPISSQTYSRKQDCKILTVLTGIAVSAHKCATDLRLLAHVGDMKEKFEETQVGSSAMPYKHNPILSERICGLSRYLISLSENTSYTAALQWLERSLDDSSNRRIVIPNAFLTADALLNLLTTIFSSLTFNEKSIKEHLDNYLPFLMMENLMTAAVKKGKDRGEMHEKMRQLSKKNKEEIFSSLGLSSEECSAEKLIGCAKSQVEKFLTSFVLPALQEKLSPT